MRENRDRRSGSLCLRGTHLLPTRVSIESKITVLPKASVLSPPATKRCFPITINPGNLRPCRVRPKLIHLCDLKSKNSTMFKLGSASEAPPATITPSLPLTRALTQECWNEKTRISHYHSFGSLKEMCIQPVLQTIKVSGPKGKEGHRGKCLVNI